MSTPHERQGGDGAPMPPRVAAEVAELFPAQGEWSEEDYFGLPESQRFLELSEGVLCMPPRPTHTHQRLVLRLAAGLQAFVAERGLGTVQIGPLPVRLWPGKIREPDVLFVAQEHQERLGEQYYGPPDLAVEVLSPSTRRTDRVEKMSEYAQAGVAEYWIVDPEAATVEVFVLRGNAYQPVGRWGEGETAASPLLADFALQVSDLFADLPLTRGEPA